MLEPMRFELFIFDFDGTLADSGPFMSQAFNRAAARFGFRQLSRDEIEAMRGRDSRTVIRELGVPMWRLPQIATYMRRLAQEGPAAALFPGISAALHALHGAGAKLAVVSSNSEGVVRRALGEGCASLIQIYACNASMFGKAAKFKRVLKRTAVAADQAIAIGDETRDIEAARAASIACGAVAWGYATASVLQAHAPDFFFHTPDDIAALGQDATAYG
jgi:phosphoglycolate phosphatase